jgi:peroxiredoxin
MALRQSTMLQLGTPAPDFALPDTAGWLRRLDDFAGSRGLLVAFICNHCPYVKHILEGFVHFAHDYGERGIAVVAISANDVATHPQDAPGEMAKLAHDCGFGFPYLHDESQHVAKAYRAVCTPDFFLFDATRHLAYRGQFDDSRPGNGKPVTGTALRAAADAILRGERVVGPQIPSVGCNIKWKPGAEPDWA